MSYISYALETKIIFFKNKSLLNFRVRNLHNYTVN